MRRLAAEDSSIDLIGMDVIWTAEFAEAGWILPWDGRTAAGAPTASSTGRAAAVEYQDKVWAIPFTTNTQLLCYRKDKVDTPPEDYLGRR